MTDMREYAAQHGWEVGSHLRYAGGVGPSSVITSIEADEVRISTPGDFPGRLTHSTRLEKWTLDWQYRAEQAEAAIARVRALHGRHDPNCPYGEDCAGAGLCLACREEYPCATIRAIEGEL